MQYDTVKIKHFYSSRLGTLVSDLLWTEIGPMVDVSFDSKSPRHILGLGYPIMYLNQLLHDRYVYMGQSDIRHWYHWPIAKPNKSVLLEEESLPFPDDSMDRVLWIHGIEHAPNPTFILREIWRVLSPEGRFILVVPNRLGLWTHLDNNPFGFGQPYNKRQITNVLENNMFTVKSCQTALHFLPYQGVSRLQLALAKRLLKKIGRAIGGVLCVEAVKQIYALHPFNQKASAKKKLFVEANICNMQQDD